MIAENRPAQVEIAGGDILIDAALLGELLDVVPADVPTLMRAHAITSRCERGIDAHQGEFRLSFFYRSRRARLSVDTSGRILRRSVIDFSQRRLPAEKKSEPDMHNPSGPSQSGWPPLKG
jgi:hypothetical protein